MSTVSEVTLGSLFGFGLTSTADQGEHRAVLKYTDTNVIYQVNTTCTYTVEPLYKGHIGTS